MDEKVRSFWMQKGPNRLLTLCAKRPQAALPRIDSEVCIEVYQRHRNAREIVNEVTEKISKP
jgi:hypothetical protein